MDVLPETVEIEKAIRLLNENSLVDLPKSAGMMTSHFIETLG
jgi:hypothetical protein